MNRTASSAPAASAASCASPAARAAWPGPATARTRLAGVLGTGAGAATLALVIGLFGNASTDPWLAPTAENLAMVRACESDRDRAAREQCRARAVASAKLPQPARQMAGLKP